LPVSSGLSLVPQVLYSRIDVGALAVKYGSNIETKSGEVGSLMGIRISVSKGFSEGIELFMIFFDYALPLFIAGLFLFLVLDWLNFISRSFAIHPCPSAIQFPRIVIKKCAQVASVDPKITSAPLVRIVLLDQFKVFITI